MERYEIIEILVIVNLILTIIVLGFVLSKIVHSFKKNPKAVYVKNKKIDKEKEEQKKRNNWKQDRSKYYVGDLRYIFEKK